MMIKGASTGQAPIQVKREKKAIKAQNKILFNG
jgi:hypothetical protein